MHYLSITILLALFVLFGANTSKAQTSTIYVNDMDYVIGDVKQAFIQNKITTHAKADNLINGFKNLKVNGIRIPIYAEGLNPNKAMFDYFYQQAVAAGFPIFANPAQSSGGQRIANGVLNSSTHGGPVKDNPVKTQNLINRIKAFSQEYACKWINPFNEDGRPGSAWSASQINTIYESLDGQLNGAELIGSCVWGIGAGILLMENTNMSDHITVATTHNLGFEHAKWPAFIALADAKELPVWDSETNNYDKFGTGTRIQVAIDAGVDGLVLYNTWANINLTSGVINNAGLNLMDIYLKPNSTGTESIEYSQNFKCDLAPNPAKDEVSIQLQESIGDYQLFIIDLTGKVVFQSTEYETQKTIQINHLPAGIYFVKIMSEKMMTTSKLIIE